MKVSISKVTSVFLFAIFMMTALRLIHDDPWYLVAGSIFIGLVSVPGVILATLLRLEESVTAAGEYITYVVCLSLLYLMTLGFFTNQVLATLWDVSDPLMHEYLYPILALGLMILALVTYYFRRGEAITLPRVTPSKFQASLLVGSLSIPITAALGAVQINNGYVPFFALMALILVMVYGLLGVFLRKHLTPGVYQGLLFSMTFGLLLTVSLRGWYTTGHDNQLEYYMFQLTHQDYFWDIAEYRDPYNASLSITILPTVFASITRVPPVYVFKILFQAIFSIVSVGLFAFLYRYTKPVIAFLGVMSFISLPNFFTGMPMLNRQEVGMLFFVSILLTVLSTQLSGKMKHRLFIGWSIGIVWGHYATAYVAFALFVAVYIGTAIVFSKWVRRHSYFAALEQIKPTITFSMLVVLFSAIWLWNNTFTQTSKGLRTTVGHTYEELAIVVQEKGVMGAVATFLPWNTTVSEDPLEGYVRESIETFRTGVAEENLYPLEIYTQYPIVEKSEETVKLTAIGTWLEQHSVPMRTLHAISRTVAAMMLQIGVLFGLVFSVFSITAKSIRLPVEYVVLSISGFGLLVSFMLLPGLSSFYGVERLFQQQYLFLVLPFLLLLFHGTRRILRQATIMTLGLLIVLLYTSFSGMLPYITGGYYPQIHLYNFGTEYDAYVLHDTEHASAQWLAGEYSSKYDVFASPSTRSKLVSASEGIFSLKNLLPAVIKRDAYVYLDRSNVQENEEIGEHNGEEVLYIYPIEFLDDHKDLLYSNSGSRVYR